MKLISKKSSHHVYFFQNQTLKAKSVLKFKIMEGLMVQNRNSDLETGLAIKDSFIAKSGFNYQTGIRDFGSLKIVEGVSKGTASIFLTSLMVFDSEKKLLLDCEIGRLTNYSRETVRKMVLHGLITMLREATEKQGKHFDEIKAYELVDNQLKEAYYESSYKAALAWAELIGINIS
jgi:hypothetical protein